MVGGGKLPHELVVGCYGFEEIVRDKKKIEEDLQGITPQYLNWKRDHLLGDLFFLREEAAGDVSLEGRVPSVHGQRQDPRKKKGHTEKEGCASFFFSRTAMLCNQRQFYPTP